MKPTRVLLLAFAFVVLMQSAVNATELDELQGKWEFRFQEQGKPLRAVKIIEGNKETVETYDGDKLVHRHVVMLEEKQTEGFTVIKYGESEVTHGPRKGQRGKPGSFLSKRRGDKWYNIQGMETDSDAQLIVMEFIRIKEAAEPVK